MGKIISKYVILGQGLDGGIGVEAGFTRLTKAQKYLKTLGPNTPRMSYGIFKKIE